MSSLLACASHMVYKTCHMVQKTSLRDSTESLQNTLTLKKKIPLSKNMLPGSSSHKQTLVCQISLCRSRFCVQVWDTPSIAMKMPFATPAPSRRPSEAGSHAPGSEAGTPDHPWGLVLGQFATVARHDPRPEVSLHPPIFLSVPFGDFDRSVLGDSCTVSASNNMCNHVTLRFPDPIVYIWP